MVVKTNNWTLGPLEFKKHCQVLSVVFIVQITAPYINFLYKVPSKWSINWLKYFQGLRTQYLTQSFIP